MAPSRQRRRKRTPSPQQEPVIEPDEDYPNIVFKNEDQRDKFQNLKERHVISSRFICANLLRNLGLFEYAMHFFRAIGMGFMFNMHRETYPELVLEFLSSLTTTQDDYRETSLYFRIDGIERQITTTELADLFGLNDTGGGLNYEQHRSQIWPLILGEHLTNLQNLILKKVHHPILKIWFKFMTFTITAKSESNKANSKDLIILSLFHRPKWGFTFNLARLLVHTFRYIFNLILFVHRYSLANSSHKLLYILVGNGKE